MSESQQTKEKIPFQQLMQTVSNCQQTLNTTEDLDEVANAVKQGIPAITEAEKQSVDTINLVVELFGNNGRLNVIKDLCQDYITTAQNNNEQIPQEIMQAAQVLANVQPDV